MDPFLQSLGEILRETRLSCGLSLREAAARSDGAFKAPSLACYERAERSISLQRFCRLAAVYRTPADRLLAQALERMGPSSRAELALDLVELRRASSDEGRCAARFAHQVMMERGDFMTDVLTLRGGDLQMLAMASGHEPEEFRRRLRDAALGEAGS